MNNERGFFNLNTLDLVKSCTTNLEYKTKQPTTTILAVGHQEVYSFTLPMSWRMTSLKRFCDIYFSM